MSPRAQKLEASRAPLADAEQARAAARDRSAHDLEARQRRDQESVAADHRRRHRRQGLREGARRRARRRSRRAGRSVRADALDQCRRRPSTIRRCRRASSRWPSTSRRRPNWRAAWRRSASCRSDRGAELASQLQDRPAAGVARRRSSGAGTASSPRPMRRPAPHGASPSAPASSTSSTNWSRPAPTPHDKRQALETAAGRAEGGCRRRDARAANAGAPRSARPTPRASAMPRPSARSAATPRACPR